MGTCRVSIRVENQIEAFEDIHVITGESLLKSINKLFNVLPPRSVERAHICLRVLCHCKIFELEIHELMLKTVFF